MTYTNDILLKDGRECRIRSAVAEDAQEVLDVFYRTHEQTDFLASYADEKTLDAAFEETFLRDKEQSEKEVYLCAVVDGQIVGTAGVFSLGTGKVGHRASLGLAIDKEYWGLGIGRALTEASIALSKKAGYRQLELEVVSDNESAVALYQKAGFTECGRNPRGLLSRYQGWQELVTMRRELDGDDA